MKKMNIIKEMNEKRWILVNKWMKKDEDCWINEWKKMNIIKEMNEKNEYWWINEW